MEKNRNKLSRLLEARPKFTSLNNDIVGLSSLGSGGNLTSPIVFSPTVENVNLFEWVKNNRNKIIQDLENYGAILFRGFRVSTIEEFKKGVAIISDDFMEYKQRSSPRTEISDMIYTSTDYPSEQSINMHSELSYSFMWPLRISFCCMHPADVGGETPIADNREVCNSLSNEVKQRFYDKGILYVRNLKEGFGLSWKQVFQTDSQAEVEKYCEENSISYHWKSKDILVLSWKTDAIHKHPNTGEHIWFNHAYFFNIGSSQAMNIKDLKDEDLPFNTYYGDGTEIEEFVIKQIGDAYRRSLKIFEWQKGDWLLLDNMLFSHGRNPFKGNRKIVVAMTDPVSRH